MDSSFPMSKSEIKNCLLGIMDGIHDFCISHKINYSLAYGSLLGAIRHKGFIPWDDDIDIFILRKDYDLFVKEFNRNRNDSYRFLSRETDPLYYLPIAKVIDTNTSVRELDWAEEIGCYVDVFVVDNLTDDIKTAKSMLKRIRRRQKLIMPFQIAYTERRSCIKKYVLSVLKSVLRWVDYYHVVDSISAIAQEHKNEENGKYCGSVMLLSYNEREIMHSEWFREFVPNEFEGRAYLVTQNYDDILAQLYGDYVTLPPLSQRVSHHAFSAFWKENPVS